MKNKITYLITWILFLHLTLINNIYAQSALQDHITYSINLPEVKHAQIGVSVFDANEGYLVAGYNHDKSFIPASSLKILTTLAAFEKLGKDFKYQTVIAYTGEIIDSILYGNLHIIGSGDPSLGSKRISEGMNYDELISYIVYRIHAHGIKGIEGNLVVDESAYDSYPVCPTWQWEDLGSNYASGAWGINVNENEYEVWYDTNKNEYDVATIQKIYPEIKDLKLTNEIYIDSQNDDDPYIFGGPYSFEKRVVGTLPKSKNPQRIKGCMPDPPKQLAQTIFQNLNGSSNIHCKDFEVHFYKKVVSGLKSIDTIKSQPLVELIKLANYHSINIYCESFLKTLGLVKGNRGSGKEGAHIVNHYLIEQGIDPTVLNMEDGSGLSSRNRISPYLLTQLLANFGRNYSFETLSSLLPEAGDEGTVRRMLKNSSAKGNVWMKSGTMRQIMTYTGIMKTKSGRWITFSIMSNGYTQSASDMRKWIEDVIDGIYKTSI